MVPSAGMYAGGLHSQCCNRDLPGANDSSYVCADIRTNCSSYFCADSSTNCSSYFRADSSTNGSSDFCESRAAGSLGV